MAAGGGAAISGAAEYELVRILTQAASLPDAGERLLELVARHGGWSVGALWLRDEDRALLRCMATWAEEGSGAEEFAQRTARLTFAPGVGLPGTVWAGGEAAWYSDVVRDTSFPRSGAAGAAGLRTAVLVPVSAHDETLGVVEFFAKVSREPRPGELDLLVTIGHQLGQFAGRLLVEERLRASEAVAASVVRAALDCVVTMDHDGRVLDFNPAAETTFGYAREEAVGQVLAELIIPPALRELHREALQRYLRTREPGILGRRLELTAMRADGSVIPVELTITRVGEREPPVFAGFVRDITERRRTEERLTQLLELEREARLRAERAERSTRSIAETLQRSLLPPHLPEIPSVELGAAYRPAAGGTLVGGDFYDVFELGDDRWGVAIGDVRGKGAYAASVTALMRYTIRTAAVREPSAAAVLGVLNRALLANPEGGDYCTAIYASLDVGFGRIALQLAVGGHPLPVLRTAAGETATVGVPGTLLGAVAAPSLIDHELILEPGDSLTLYTDGVTETRTPEGLFGVERLCALLGELPALDAGAIARRVEAAVVDDPTRRATDDVALLVLQARAP